MRPSPLVRGMPAGIPHVDPVCVNGFAAAQRAYRALFPPAISRSSHHRGTRWIRSRAVLTAAVTLCVLGQAGTSLGASPSSAGSTDPKQSKTPTAGSEGTTGAKRTTNGRAATVNRGRDPRPPTVPGRVRVRSDAGGRPTVTWSPASDDRGVVRWYRVYRGGGYVASTEALSFRFSAVPCGARQRFGVRAVDAGGRKSREGSVRFRRACTSRSVDRAAPPVTGRSRGSVSSPAPPLQPSPSLIPIPSPASALTSGLASSSGASPAPPGTPILVTGPTIAGSPQTGARLIASAGVWSGIEPGSLSFQWYRCRAGTETCVALAGRSNPTYVPTWADVGFVLRVAVTAADSGLSITAASEPTDIVALSNAAPECNGVSVNPSVNLQAMIDANPGGTTFCLRSGLYRLEAPITPKTNNSFIGEPGAVLNGALDISSAFQPSGSIWVASNMTMERQDSAPCKGGGGVTACRWLNDVYYDDSVLKRVGSVGELRSGTFFLDYADDKIYVADTPEGHLVEVGVTSRAIATLSVPRYPEGVTLRGLRIEKFANAAQQGAVEGFKSWLVDGNTFRLNHGEGLDVGQSSIVRNNSFVSNGQLGFGVGYWTNILFEDNLVAENNYAGYQPNWEAGGAKFYKVSGLTVRNNVSRDNDGIGLWTDWESIDVLYEGNWVESNAGPGIFHEAGYSAVIRENYITGNGFESDGWIDGSGILINSSRDVTIHDNVLQDNYQGIGATATDRGTGDFGVRVLQNLYVHDNVIAVTRTPPDYWAVAAGIAGDTMVDRALMISSSNRWLGNKYIVCSHVRFHMRKPLTWAQWKSSGMDEDGSITVVC